jgi:hypothetical protein
VGLGRQTEGPWTWNSHHRLWVQLVHVPGLVLREFQVTLHLCTNSTGNNVQYVYSKHNTICICICIWCVCICIRIRPGRTFAQSFMGIYLRCGLFKILKKCFRVYIGLVYWIFIRVYLGCLVYFCAILGCFRVLFKVPLRSGLLGYLWLTWGWLI